ncbi:MAG TPA: RNA-binding S4 domain-containing protein [Syntrophomonadaceae bacterium]|nr:RNA-binding S4 domain-containing protein [Syntrophomonadaceae bacterium]
MRLDKYLKVSRIIKRRTTARDFAANERVLVNGRVAKPSTPVDIGDVITVKLGERTNSYEVLELREHIKATEAKNLYRIIE